jgi:hypothetical protein
MNVLKCHSTARTCMGRKTTRICALREERPIQLENMCLAVPPEIVGKLPERVRELIGYSIHPLCVPKTISEFIR